MFLRSERDPFTIAERRTTLAPLITVCGTPGRRPEIHTFSAGADITICDIED